LDPQSPESESPGDAELRHSGAQCGVQIRTHAGIRSEAAPPSNTLVPYQALRSSAPNQEIRPNEMRSGIGNSQVTSNWWSNGLPPVCPSGPTLESWVVWSSVPITEAATHVNEGEVPLRMKYGRASDGRAGVGVAGGMRFK
jgi:hypothetical protein